MAEFSVRLASTRGGACVSGNCILMTVFGNSHYRGWRRYADDSAVRLGLKSMCCKGSLKESELACVLLLLAKHVILPHLLVITGEGGYRR